MLRHGKRFSLVNRIVLLVFSITVTFGIVKSTTAADRINYRLKWLFNASVVGDIVADAEGFFSQAGLDVVVKEGGPERDAIRELELGHAQFGVASADQVIRALSKGSPVVVLAQLFQVNPLQWVYRAGEIKLNSLEDLKGQKIGITYGGNDETIMRTLLAKAALDEKDVLLHSVRYDVTPFYRKKVDIWPCYINSQGPILRKKLKEAGEKAAFFNPAAFGVQFVANSVVTSQQMLDTDPDLVKLFIDSLLKGWQQALVFENQDQTLKILGQYDQETAPELIKEQLKVTRDLILPDANSLLGAIDIDAWKQTETILLDQKLIPGPVYVENHLKPQ